MCGPEIDATGVLVGRDAARIRKGFGTGLGVVPPEVLNLGWKELPCGLGHRLEAYATLNSATASLGWPAKAETTSSMRASHIT